MACNRQSAMSFSLAPKISRSECSKASKRRANKRRRRRSARCSTKCGSDERRSKAPCWSSTEGVAERLHALKELIPSMGGNDEDQNAVTADEIFEGTANYILLLRTRVHILKHLVEFYGPGVNVEDNAPVS